jgi:RNA polymerase subunit RPABC4/transcription elongation factor Spt4
MDMVQPLAIYLFVFIFDGFKQHCHFCVNTTVTPSWPGLAVVTGACSV